MTTTYLPADSAAVRDSVIYEDIGTGAFLNTTYGHCSPTFPNPLIVFPEILKTTFGHVYERYIIIYNNYYICKPIARGLLIHRHAAFNNPDDYNNSFGTLNRMGHVLLKTSFLTFLTV